MAAGFLDYDELAALLRVGNPAMTDLQIRSLFKLADVDGSGTIEFNEFVNLITEDQQEKAAEMAKSRLGAKNSLERMASEPVRPKSPLPPTTSGKLLAPSQKSVGGSRPSSATSNNSQPSQRGKRRCSTTSTFSAGQPSLKSTASKKSVTSEKDGVKWLFDQLDADGSCELDKEELALLLRTGDKDMQDAQIELLFDLADKDKDGLVDFNEFCEFIDSEHEVTWLQDIRQKLQAASNLASLSLASFSGGLGQGSDVDAKNLRRVFNVVAGKDRSIDSSGFSKFCRRCNLYTKTFIANDADIIFAQACTKGEHRLKLKQFQEALRLVAEKKECSFEAVYAAIADYK